MDYTKIIASGLVPDGLFRWGVRRILSGRLNREPRRPEERQEMFHAFLDNIEEQPVAIHERDANEQHYELPTRFFELILGERLKYSACFWEKGMDLDRAEEKMLSLCSERADISDGQSLLELGCGWGSLCLFLAERYPRSAVTAVSNSSTQKDFIEARARQKGLSNLTVITDNVATMEMSRTYDRILSVEMFEHMRNYPRLFRKVSSWLNPGGKLFIHVFAARGLPFHYDSSDPQDWMARHFFAGGTMPSHDLFLHCLRGLNPRRTWIVDGRHYGKTLRTWLRRMDRRKAEILPILDEVYGPERKKAWWHNWRAFFIVCEELFKFRGGREWFVSHYLFEKE